MIGLDILCDQVRYSLFCVRRAREGLASIKSKEENRSKGDGTPVI
jgi:hypothetical protein